MWVEIKNLINLSNIKEPVVLDCQIEIICAQWNHDGSILAIGGIQVLDDKESNICQFYSPWGQVSLTNKII